MYAATNFPARARATTFSPGSRHYFFERGAGVRTSAGGAPTELTKTARSKPSSSPAARSGGVKKLEASYNIVTANEEEIRRANPKSTADLLKISPGMWPESTRRPDRRQHRDRGLPGRRRRAVLHDAADGLAAVRHADAVVLRDDQHLPARRHRALGGDPAGRTVGGVRRRADGRDRQLPAEDRHRDSGGQLRASRTATKISCASTDSAGFPLGEDWYGSVGGFWRTSDGVRDPQFKADEGGQLTATLKHESDSGQAHVLCALPRRQEPVHHADPGDPDAARDNFSEYPGFDPLTSTYNSNAIRHVRLDGYPGGGTNADLANGRGAQMFFLGAQLRPRVRQRLVDQRQAALQQRRRRHQRVVLGQQSRDAERRAVHDIRRDLGGFELPAGSATATFVGGGAVARRPERDPPGLVVHPQGAREPQQRFAPEQGAVRRQHADRRPVPRLLHDGRRVGARQPDVDDQRAERAADHRELSSMAARHVPADRRAGLSRQRRLQHHASAATRSTGRSIYRTRGASTSGCWTPRCATRTRTPPTASAT